MTDVGNIFIGIGLMMNMLIVAWFIYQVARVIKPVADKEEKFELFEELMLDKVAKKKGIDLAKEKVKRNFIKKRPSFRRKLEVEIYEEMFGKIKEDK